MLCLCQCRQVCVSIDRCPEPTAKLLVYQIAYASLYVRVDMKTDREEMDAVVCEIIGGAPTFLTQACNNSYRCLNSASEPVCTITNTFTGGGKEARLNILWFSVHSV